MAVFLPCIWMVLGLNLCKTCAIHIEDFCGFPQFLQEIDDVAP
jgi:hypothetical protein